MEYVTSKMVAEMFGCSLSGARDIMSKLPCFRPCGRGRGSQIYVKKSDLDNFIAQNTIQPGTPLPRATEWVSKKEQADIDLKTWHRNKRLGSNK
jgi:hypothetical protein